MALSAIILNSIDEQIKLLDVAPQLVPQLQALLSDGNTNPDDILELIKLDTAMSARMIKTSNTAFFNPGFRISSIEDAVTYLGYDEVYRIISMLAFARLMRQPLRYYNIEAGDLWRRALACALAMEGLCPAVDAEKRVGYTIGLLHAIGCVFVDRQLAAHKTPLPDTPLPEQEVRLLGVNHAEVGAHVMRLWNFPEELFEPVRCQFEPMYCLTHGKLAALLHTSRHMMESVLRPPPDGQSPPEPDPLVLTMINLHVDEYLDVLEEVEGKFALLEVATVEL